MKHPINKFISDTISFCIFLVLLVLVCSNDDHTQEAGRDLTIVEYLTLFWVTGEHDKILVS